MQQTDLDIAIFGAGIAGLWTLARLRQAGYRVALFERQAIGGVQSIASQGIIHGGTKYALTGKLTGSAMAIGEMPGIWRAALTGGGEIDLSGVRILAEHQHLWSTGSLASGMAGFFAGKVMQARMQPLSREDLPRPFDTPGFRGSVYRLDEPVLDPLSLAEVLNNRLGDCCYLFSDEPQVEREENQWRLDFQDAGVVTAGAVVLTAGLGNAKLLRNFGRSGPPMQTRPLHMLMLKGDLPMLHAHCLGASANPRLTITGYPQADGKVVWYLGGQVAEEGIERSSTQQIAAGQTELAELLPWMRFDNVAWATLKIDRAEIQTARGKRPDDAYVGWQDRLATCWPTKLAFAPRVAQLVLQGLHEQDVMPDGGMPDPLGLPHPPLARLPWDDTAWS